MLHEFYSKNQLPSADKGEGVKKCKNFADVINGWTLRSLAHSVGVTRWHACERKRGREGVRAQSAVESQFSPPTDHSIGSRGSKDACTYDVRKFFGFLDPLPPCPNFALTYSIEFTQPPLLHLLLAQPPPPQGGRHMNIAPYLVTIHVIQGSTKIQF